MVFCLLLFYSIYDMVLNLDLICVLGCNSQTPSLILHISQTIISISVNEAQIVWCIVFTCIKKVPLDCFIMWDQYVEEGLRVVWS